MREKKPFSWELTPGFFLILFWTAFGAGALGINIFWEAIPGQGNLLGMFILFQSARRELAQAEYFFYVLRHHGSWLFICLLAGFSPWGVPVAVFSTAALGILVGVILTLSILQFGILGIFCGAALLFPQFLCYIPSVIFLMSILAQRSGRFVKKDGRNKKDSLLRQKMFWGSLCLYLGGMILESFVNPFVLDFVLSHVKIF
ncbi:MAG TPA: stage II sporulation protein M [Candidatus Blautia intestinigallinarum]|nr:stage II sporulation protein M [Candidatus Blautia intestinigallinarum]